MLFPTFVSVFLGLVPTTTFARSLGQNARQTTSCENTATSRNCWGDYDLDTDYYEVTPDTGVTREYWLTAEKTTLAPDGYLREVLVFNGTIPGPTIEADWGDNIVIHVTNTIPDNGTSIHWHGIRQLNTNSQDGVPGVTQCPIAPGDTMTYRFRASQYGSSWYHSHFSLQLAEGLFGPIVIHGPTTANYDVDVGPVLIGDWAHVSAFKTWTDSERKFALSRPDDENGHINGLNPYDCTDSTDPACIGTTARFETTFEPGKKYLMRVVGVHTDSFMKFTIDNHTLTVVAADFVPIVPYEADSIILGSGQRYDIIVEANQNAGAFWMHAIYQTACNRNSNQNANNIKGIVRYAGDTSGDPTTTVKSTITNSCGDEDYDKLVPWVSHQVGDSTIQETVGVQWYYQLDAVYKWTLRGKSLTIDWSSPTIMNITGNETTFSDDNNVVTVESKGEWVYWVIEDLTLVDAFHPMHLHGHDFYILAQAEGLFIPGITTLNTDNPPRRDTATLYGYGYTVIAFKTDNPGSWLFHCHIAWHASQGLAMQLVESAAEIPSMIGENAEALSDTCAAWVPFYNSDAQAGSKMDDSGI